MPTHIVDVDLNQPLDALALPAEARRLLALVRWHGVPHTLLWADSSAQLLTALHHLPHPAFHSSLFTFHSSPISIIVCTHERPDELWRCLDALRPLAERGHEVIVVDNAPRTTRTQDLCVQYPYRYLCEPRQGLDHARNCGLHAATHSIIAYTDDDAAPDPRWADAIAQPFVSKSVGGVTGLVFPLELETVAQEQFELYCANRRAFDRREFSSPPLPPSAAGVAGMGANMAFRRDLVLRLGGFDPRLDGGTATCSGGDTDMFARVLETGAHIVYNPAALVWHHHRREDAALRSCLFGYGVGLFSFLTKRVIEHHDWPALITAARWWAGPLAKAARRAAQGQPTVPLSLLLLEAWGAFFGPYRLWQATQQQNNRR